MPIKCAGAPQKAIYLLADHWHQKRLADIEIGLYSAGAVLLGVPDYVPALMDYVERYKAKLNFQHTLTAIDGPARKAYFETAGDQRASRTIDVIKIAL